jgi:hypothetical protein
LSFEGSRGIGDDNIEELVAGIILRIVCQWVDGRFGGLVFLLRGRGGG